MLYIILPAYNEEKNLAELLNRIKTLNWDFPYKAVVINDGSSDNTEKVARELSAFLPIVILNHAVNVGLGGALKTAFDYLKENIKSEDVVITMDADNTHPVDMIPPLAGEIKKGFDIIVASRFCKGGKTYGVPFVRNLMSRIASILFKLLVGIKNVSDYSSGFRAYSGSCLRKYFMDTKDVPLVTEKGFTAGSEILVKLSKFAKNIGEMPLELRYDYKKGKSKMKLFRTIAEYIRFIWRNRGYK